MDHGDRCLSSVRNVILQHGQEPTPMISDAAGQLQANQRKIGSVTVSFFAAAQSLCINM